MQGMKPDGIPSRAMGLEGMYQFSGTSQKDLKLANTEEAKLRREYYKQESENKVAYLLKNDSMPGSEQLYKHFYRVPGVGLPAEDAVHFLIAHKDGWKNHLKRKVMEKR